VPALQPGHHRLTVNKQGFKQIEVTDVTLDGTDTATRNFHLEPGAPSEIITVEGEGININTSDASVSTVISREFVDEIPLNGRTLQNLLPMVPGIGYDTSNQGYTVNGTRVQEGAYWTVDGISGNITASLSVGNNLPDSFGGPVTIPHVYHGRNKAFFFFSFEDLNLLQPTSRCSENSPWARRPAFSGCAWTPSPDQSCEPFAGTANAARFSAVPRGY
jgi:hypothetical protein